MATHLTARDTRALSSLSAVAAVALAITVSTPAGAEVQSGRIAEVPSAAQAATAGGQTLGSALHAELARPLRVLDRARIRAHAVDVRRTRAQEQVSIAESRIQEMIAAGDQIATLPYIYGGGHGSFASAGYDCSGSVSYVLHAAGLLSTPEDSSELESYGEPGPGKYVTIYANAGHAFMTIDGRRFDTIALQETGTRWSDEIGSTDGYVAVHPPGM